MRSILGANVKNLMEHHYRESANKPKALAVDAHVSLSTVQRILVGETGATIDNIESLATAFSLSAYQLLLPRLDPANPGVIKGATKDEEVLYRNWKREKLPLFR